MADDLTSFAIRLQRLLHRMVRLYELCDRTCLVSKKVTAAQGYTLLALQPGKQISMNDLSEAMGLASSTMTRTVDGLVKNGLVQRKPGAEDRRVVRVWLTGRGADVRQTLEASLEGFFKGALGELRVTERTTVLQAMEKVVTSLELGLRSSNVS